MSPSWTVRKSMVWALVAVNVFFIAVIVYLAPRTILRVRTPQSSSSLPVLATPRDFELTRENSASFSSSALKGHPWVADFIFTRCPNQCPAMSFRFAKLQKILPAGVKLVSFSVDPEYDSPARLLEYGHRFEANPEKWIFLTGPADTVHGIQSDLKLTKPEEREAGLHSLRFVLMDGQGHARGYYDSQDNASLETLMKDLKKLETA